MGCAKVAWEGEDGGEEPQQGGQCGPMHGEDGFEGEEKDGSGSSKRNDLT